MYANLDENIEDNMEVATVDKHVGQESPNLLLLVWIEYQRPLQQRIAEYNYRMSNGMTE